MKIKRAIRNRRKLQSRMIIRLSTCAIGESLRKVRAICCRVFSTPMSTVAPTVISVILPNIISVSRHVINNCIGVNSNTCFSACIYEGTKIISRSMSIVKFVWYWLIVEPPGIKFPILNPLVCENWFLRRENADTHITHFRKSWTFCLNIFVWPSKHLNNGSFLAIQEIRRLNNFWSVPYKIKGF